jgi:DNA repair exonuclease SbcCD nuclease subunit
MHGTFEGSVYNNIVGNGRLFTIHDSKMCRGFMVGGHVHKPGCFSGYFYYCGCPYRWKFGEEEDKGFLICSHDLDTHQHYVHFEKIYSDNYITIDLEDIVGNDPRAVIAYIDDLKKSQGIDYLKVRFRYPVAGADKVIINNNYRENHNIFVEFMNISEEQKAKTKQASGAVIDDDYSFILDDKLSDMEKFVKYANYQEGYEFITVDKLKQILSEGF